ncbi:MAG TPA: hypothetical protein VMR52_02555 [Dehalococcoidia bacterium]|nr:hypothetical protein [Dehalococcoidia bacterium]
MTLRLTLVALAAGMMAIACASGDDDDATGTPAPTSSPDAVEAMILYRDAVGFIVAQDLESGDAIGHPVDFNSEVVVWAACSPDGGRIAFLRQYFDRRTRTLEIRDASGAQEFELPATTQGFDWSPDGTRIAFTEFDGFANTHKVTVMDLASGETTELSSGEAIAGSPAWSPDGSVIAYDIADILSTRADIFLLDPEGGEPEQVPIEGEGQWRDPAWAPDGGLLVAGLVDGRQQLYRVPAGGGEPAILTDSPDIFKGSPRYAPDGSLIAYTGSIILEQLSAAIMKLHSFGIFLVNANGSSERALTVDPRLNPGSGVDPYLDAYLLGWCLPGAWQDETWEPLVPPTPVGEQ